MDMATTEPEITCSIIAMYLSEKTDTRSSTLDLEKRHVKMTDKSTVVATVSSLLPLLKLNIIAFKIRIGRSCIVDNSTCSQTHSGPSTCTEPYSCAGPHSTYQETELDGDRVEDSSRQVVHARDVPLRQRLGQALLRIYGRAYAIHC